MQTLDDPLGLPADAPQVLAGLLSRDREKFNARFAVAKARRPALSAREWKHVLREDVALLVLAVHSSQVLEARSGAVAEAAFEVALELLCRDRIGPRTPDGAMSILWREVLPSLAPIVASDPRRVLQRASNALEVMRAHGLHETWVGRLQVLASDAGMQKCDGAMFEQAAFVLAWRCGLAHARAKALKYLRALPFEVGCALMDVGVEESRWIDLLERLEREPFFDPTRAEEVPTLRLVAQAGEWEAWGGTMAAPPRLARRRGALWAWSGRTWLRIYADAFGATLTPARFSAPFEEGRDESCGAWKLNVLRDPDGSPSLEVSHGPNTAFGEAQTVVLPGFDGVLSAASDEHVLAFSSPLSLRVFVVARAAC